MVEGKKELKRIAVEEDKIWRKRRKKKDLKEEAKKSAIKEIKRHLET